MLLTRQSVLESKAVLQWEPSELDSAEGALAAGGIGALESAAGNLPLAQLSVRAEVTGLSCQTFIAQVFCNPHDEFLEATYIFPLPGRFAVTDCSIRVGGRVIKAELKERSQARADYDRALSTGHRAAIAEEERSETFSLRVGNIPPREEVTVELTVVGTLAVAAGEATLRIPLVVAPRYVSGLPLDGPSVGSGTAADTDAVPDASRVTPPTLLPGFKSPVALSIDVELRPGATLADSNWQQRIRSSLHSVFVSSAQGENADAVKIRLQPGERLNRDFILRFPVLPEALAASLDYALPAGDRLGTFAVTVLPPALPPGGTRPRDVVFVLDRSGSMEGWKMTAARRALARMIDTLGETDRFRVLAFDDRLELQPGSREEWRHATDRHRWQASEWIAQIQARGGTELGGALRAALQPFTFGMPQDREALVVLVTDGQVAGEDSVVRTLESQWLPRPPRVFALGIDRAVNAGLLARLAAWGGGACELVESEERLSQVLERMHQCLGAAVLTDVRIEPLDFDLVQGSLTPQAGLAAFADRPLTIYGRAAAGQNIRLRVTGRDASGQAWSQELTARQTQAAALLPLWGRGRVRDLEDRYARGGEDSAKLQAEIVAVSLESHILSRFTAYVAVDKAEVVNQGGIQHQIVQPVEEPEGWVMGIAAKSLGVSRGPVDAIAGGMLRSKQRRVKSPPTAAHDLVPESVARKNQVLPVREEDGKLVVRMSDPNDLDTLEKLRFILNRPIQAEAASREEIQEAINDQYGDAAGESADSVLHEFTDTAMDFCESETTVSYEELTSASGPIVRLVHLLISECVQVGASLATLRQTNRTIQIHYVISGELQRRDCPPQWLWLPIIWRLCELAKITYQPHALQWGEFNVTIGDREVSVRLYLFATPEGLAAVLRFADTGVAPPLAEQLSVEKYPPWADEAPAWLAAARSACGNDPQAVEAYRQLEADCAVELNQS